MGAVLLAVPVLIQQDRPDCATAIQPGQRGTLIVTIVGALIALAVLAFAAYFVWFFLSYFAT